MRREHGQASIEFALVMPLVVVLVVFLAQFLVLAHDQMLVESAARAAARAAAVAGAPAGAAQSAAAEVLGGRDFTISVSEQSATVTVEITRRTARMMPFIAGFVRELRADATMLVEPP